MRISLIKKSKKIGTLKFLQIIFLEKNFLSNVLNLKIKKVEKIKKRNWVAFYKKNDCEFKIGNFIISQNVKLKKNHINIPHSKAFGTGQHPSTKLAILNLEKILMLHRKKN